MPFKDLPGFYYDAEKNRYFPIKGPVPGSKRPRSFSTPAPSTERTAHRESSDKIQLSSQRKRLKSSELLQVRELNGRAIISNKCRCSFEREYQKLQASQPMVWKYHDTTGVADSALEQLHGIIQTPNGLELKKLLLMGSMNGHISLYDVANVDQYYDYMHECVPKPIWPLTKSKAWQNSVTSRIWCLADSQNFSSRISCIRRFCRTFPDTPDDVSSSNHALVTTFGSGAAGGSICILNMQEPLDILHSSTSISSRIIHVKSFNRTIWTADCNPHGSHAMIGTNRGASLVDLETKELSMAYPTRSDVFSVQFINSGNVVLCGLRNGAVIPIDTRQRQSRLPELSARSLRRSSSHRTSNRPLARNQDNSASQRYLNSSNNAVFMSSAVCSLVAFQSDEQYFLSSSMDGSIKLFDLRLLQRAVQSYAGQVNSHTHLQLGVDPSETLVMSGGEDCFLRTWSIKSGELIFGEKISDSIFTTICWPRNGNNLYGVNKSFKQSINSRFPIHSWGTWMGSPDGLFYIHGT